MPYTGFFVRDVLGQKPGDPGAAWSNSPDVIVLGDAPIVLDGFVSHDGYNTDPGQNVELNQVNYVYLRAINTDAAATQSAPVTGRAWFFYVESDLVLWPQTWRSDGVTVAGTPVNYQPISATGIAAVADPGVFGDPICLTAQPFAWTPQPPSANTHYCLVSWIENQPSEPPENPAAGFGPLSSFEALVQFVVDHPNMGWRNTVDVANAGPSWSYTTCVTGPLEAAPFFVGIRCNDMPIDGQVGFEMPPPGPAGSGVDVPMTQITSPELILTARVGDWPAGASSAITVNYQQGATPPPPGAAITVVLMVQASAFAHALETRPTAAQLLVAAVPHEGAEPQQMLQLGARTFAF